MTTRVFRVKIYMTPLHSLGPKIGVGENNVQLSFVGAKLLSILSQNSLPWQWESAGEKFNDKIG